MVDRNDVVIGLEVHVQLKTESKLFCSCRNQFGDRPNQNTCPVCMGLPGVLPVLNQKALDYAVEAAVALNCSIPDRSKYDRKNYYYPDLPKAYQISQYDMPLAEEGELPVEWSGGSSRVPIERVHMEEDAGKLIHARSGDESYVDYNRAGTPLIEIVTKPEISHPEEARAYLRTLKKRMEYLGVSDCNMEEGSLRCDANLSIRNPDGSLGVKTEVKNMNSFRAVESALEYEADRQTRRLDRGKSIQQGTRLWNEDEGETRPMRTKEEEHDYRYFPEPDLVPLNIAPDYVEERRETLPEMPDHRRRRLREEHGFTEEEADILTSTRATADFFEETIELGADVQTACNLIQSDLRRELNERNTTMEEIELTPENLAAIVELLEADDISSNVASELIEELVDEPGDPRAIVEERDLKQISDEGELTAIINDVLEENPDAVQDIRDGKNEAIGFLVGQVMQKTQGQANPERANEMLRETILEGS